MRRSSLKLVLPMLARASVRPLITLKPTFSSSTSFSSSFTTFSVRYNRAAAATGTTQRVSKVYASADAAVADLKSGSVVLSAGFGLCGTAETIITAMAKRKDLVDLHCCSNNGGAIGAGLSPLITNGQVSKMTLSFIGGNKVLEAAYLSGNIALELTPQGTLAERISCGGKGIPGFYTATGAGTFVETGGIPQQYAKKVEGQKGPSKVILKGIAKDVRIFPDGKRYLLEPAIKGDVAILRAHKVDKAGNCVFRYATRSFGPLMAKAATITIVEAENIVEIGEIAPEDINLPGIFVNRIVPATVPSIIEIRTITPAPSSSSSPTAPSEESTLSGDKLAALLRRNIIAKRAAKELKDGYYVNLGVGMPTLAVGYIKPEVQVWIQSENGILGMGPYPLEADIDGDLVNAGKETVTLVAGASVFDSVESFGMIRGGHVDVSILGAMEVDAAGNLASYMIPGKLAKGMGGAMDLVSNPDATKVIIATDHTDKNGRSKIVQTCTLPLTGANCVSRIITNLCVFDVDRVNGTLHLVELADGVTVEDVTKNTAAKFIVNEKLGKMEDDTLV